MTSTATLEGIRVVELAGIGPVPFCGMILADFGADVIRVDRAIPGPPPAVTGERPHLAQRGKRSVALDVKDPRGLDVLLRLVDSADVLIEGYRPGVTERMGIGPDVCLERNPGLVYGRMTGWGQSGPYAQMAGHDLNYLALTGALASMGDPAAPPPPPLNLIGDYGGGGMLLALGVALALVERARSGAGQVIDAAMLDGVTLLGISVLDLVQAGIWRHERHANVMDGGAPFYRAYQTADARYVSVAAVEARFYAILLEKLGLTPDAWPQWERSEWPAQHAELERIFAGRTRAEWCGVFEGSDACFAPVLDWMEAPDHEHVRARESYVEAFGWRHAAPAPRLSRTPGDIKTAPPADGQHTREILAELGLDAGEISRLVADGVAGEAGAA